MCTNNAVREAIGYGHRNTILKIRKITHYIFKYMYYIQQNCLKKSPTPEYLQVRIKNNSHAAEIKHRTKDNKRIHKTTEQEKVVLNFEVLKLHLQIVNTYEHIIKTELRQHINEWMKIK